MPRTQITTILAIQLLYLFYLTWASFKKKVFKHFFFSLVEFASQFSILAFLVIGCIFSYIGRDNLDSGTSEKIQIAAIFLIMVSTLLNFGYSVFLIVVALKNVVQLLKLKKIRKKVEKMEKENGGIHHISVK
jgi:ABC-type anion transport system duplicated permease subunit